MLGMESQVGRPEVDERASLLPRRSTSGESDLAEGDSGEAEWHSELWLLLKYSLPLIATYLLQYSFFVITITIAGHLSADDLAAASIGATTMNVVGMTIFEGMATALDTLCAQSYGSGNKTGVGLHIQRMLLLMALSAIPVGMAWVFSPLILPLVVKQHHLAVKAGQFLRYSLVGLPGYAAFEAGKRFLQAQGDCNAAMFVLIICAPVNAALSWLLAFPMGMGLEGAALGSALTNNLRLVLLLLYVISPQGKWSHGCWGGFSSDALRQWGPMLSLSTSGVAVLLGEWASFEILTFSTSYLSSHHLAAQTILFMAINIVWHIPFSISVAVSTRIGHLMGAGLVETARSATALFSVVFVLTGLFDGAILFVFRHQIASLFSEDSQIREIATRAMWLAAAFAVIDAVLSGVSGLMRGLGKQEVAAYIVFSANYLIAVPLAIWLELGSPGFGISGVWIGCGVGAVITTVLQSIYMRMLDWQSVVDRVKSREEENN